MSTLPLGDDPSQTVSKDLSTASRSQLASVVNNDGAKPASRHRLRTKPAKSREDVPSSDATSNAATTFLIRRVLVQEPPQSNRPISRRTPLPIEDALPPLTSSNEVDIQLYAIVAIILKDLVNTWYTKITPDHDFKVEVIQIIAHISRAVEDRLRHINLIDLMLNDLAALVGQHVRVYRLAKAQSGQYSYAQAEREVYHGLNPHPALSPVPIGEDSPQSAEQKDNESAYRQLLVNGALTVLLPNEDAQNAALRVLLCDILADLILGQVVAGKVCEGWFLHDAVTKVVSLINGEDGPDVKKLQQQQEIKSRLETFGLLSYREKQNTPTWSGKQRSGLVAWFWTIMQAFYVFSLSLRHIVQGLNKARSASTRLQVSPSSNTSKTTMKRSTTSSNPEVLQQPFLTLDVFTTFAILFRVQERMPWLQSLFAFLQQMAVFGIGRLASAGTVLDRSDDLETCMDRPMHFNYGEMPQTTQTNPARIFERIMWSCGLLKGLRLHFLDNTKL